MTYYRCRILCLVFVIFFAINSSAFGITIRESNPKWQTIENGVEIKITEVEIVTDEKTVKFGLTLVRIDLTLNSIELIDVFDQAQKIFQFSSPLALNKRAPMFNLKEIVDHREPIAIINGGYTAEFSYPIPDGLLIRRDVTITSINRRSLIQNGIFCVTDKKVSIFRIGPSRQLTYPCNDAVQAGPVLLESDGSIANLPDDPDILKPSKRSVVCKDTDGRLILAATTSEVTLSGLTKYLAAFPQKGGANCGVALNLSGGSESILYVRNGNLYTRAQLQEEANYIVGDLRNQVTSAIAIFAKTD